MVHCIYNPFILIFIKHKHHVLSIADIILIQTTIQNPNFCCNIPLSGRGGTSCITISRKGTAIEFNVIASTDDGILSTNAKYNGQQTSNSSKVWVIINAKCILLQHRRSMQCVMMYLCLNATQ